MLVWFTFLVPAYLSRPGKQALKQILYTVQFRLYAFVQHASVAVVVNTCNCSLWGITRPCVLSFHCIWKVVCQRGITAKCWIKSSDLQIATLGAHPVFCFNQGQTWLTVYLQNLLPIIFEMTATII